jgi:hypothetical protein
MNIIKPLAFMKNYWFFSKWIKWEAPIDVYLILPFLILEILLSKERR